MAMIFMLNNEDIERYAEIIPYEYVDCDNMIVYGMEDNGIPCAIALLETEYKDVIINYIDVCTKDSFSFYNFVNTISLDMYKNGFERILYRYLEDYDDLRKFACLGFTNIPGEGAVFEFTIKELSQVKLLNMPSNNSIALKDISSVMLRTLCHQIVEECKDLVEMPIHKEDYFSDCSVVYMEKNMPKGIMLLQSSGDMLQIPYIYSNSDNPMAIVDMMRFMLSNAKSKFEETTVCKAYITDSLLVKIIEKITGIKGKYQQIAIKDLSVIGEIEKKVIEEFSKWD